MYFFSLDLLDINNPLLCFITLFDLNLLRYGIRLLLENQFKPLLMDTNVDVGEGMSNPSNPGTQPGPSSANPEANPANPPATANPANPPAAPITGFIAVLDPLGQGAMGYIDPNTDRPYPTCQPYASNISQRMAQVAANRRGRYISEYGLDDVAERFFFDFMRHNYPERHENSYWNSGPVRKALRRAR